MPTGTGTREKLKQFLKSDDWFCFHLNTHAGWGVAGEFRRYEFTGAELRLFLLNHRGWGFSPLLKEETGSTVLTIPLDNIEALRFGSHMQLRDRSGRSGNLAELLLRKLDILTFEIWPAPQPK